MAIGEFSEVGGLACSRGDRLWTDLPREHMVIEVGLFRKEQQEPSGQSVTTSAVPPEVVAACNQLTSRWVDELDEEDAVVSGVGVWALLAELAIGADEVVCRELEVALGLPAEEAWGGWLQLSRCLAESPDISAALAVWVAAAVHLNQTWAERINGLGALERLGGDDRDQERLDRWASERTKGMIQSVPLELNPDLLLVLVTALALDVRWQKPFRGDRPFFFGATDAWRSVKSPAVLSRRSTDLDAVRVRGGRAGTVTTVHVDGTGDVDVVLVLGEECTPVSAVLADSIPELHHPRGTPGSRLKIGRSAPGLAVQSHDGSSDAWEIALPQFAIRDSHDLLVQAPLFGLATASDSSDGHFPGMATEPPIAVGQARQEALAEFGPDGFRAAAVTAVAMVVGSAMPREQPSKARLIQVRFDRPFGFVAVHRPTGLVLFAGAVHELTGEPESTHPDFAGEVEMLQVDRDTVGSSAATASTSPT